MNPRPRSLSHIGCKPLSALYEVASKSCQALPSAQYWHVVGSNAMASSAIKLRGRSCGR
jgi:hypothetical protein